MKEASAKEQSSRAAADLVQCPVANSSQHSWQLWMMPAAHGMPHASCWPPHGRAHASSLMPASDHICRICRPGQNSVHPRKYRCLPTGQWNFTVSVRPNQCAPHNVRQSGIVIPCQTLLGNRSVRHICVQQKVLSNWRARCTHKSD